MQEDTKSDVDDNNELGVCTVYTASKRRSIHIAFEIEAKKVEISLDISTQATLISEIISKVPVSSTTAETLCKSVHFYQLKNSHSERRNGKCHI